jgi:hypothetical protein
MKIIDVTQCRRRLLHRVCDLKTLGEGMMMMIGKMYLLTMLKIILELSLKTMSVFGIRISQDTATSLASSFLIGHPKKMETRRGCVILRYLY